VQQVQLQAPNLQQAWLLLLQEQRLQQAFARLQQERQQEQRLERLLWELLWGYRRQGIQRAVMPIRVA
jgi:hypothetical protein